MSGILSTTVLLAGKVRAEVGSESVPKLRFSVKVNWPRDDDVSSLCGKSIHGIGTVAPRLHPLLSSCTVPSQTPDSILVPLPPPPKPKSYAGWECNCG